MLDLRRSSWTMRSARPGATVQNRPATRPDRERRHPQVHRGAAGQRQRAEHEHRALGARLGALEQQPADQRRPRGRSRSARAPASTHAADDVAGQQRQTRPSRSRSAARRPDRRRASRRRRPAPNRDRPTSPTTPTRRGRAPARTRRSARRAARRSSSTKYIVAPVTASDRHGALEAGGHEQPARRADLAAERRRRRARRARPARSSRRRRAASSTCGESRPRPRGPSSAPERQEDHGRRQRRREPERRSRAEQRQQPDERRRQRRRRRHAQAPIERIRSAQLAPADVPRCRIHGRLPLPLLVSVSTAASSAAAGIEQPRRRRRVGQRSPMNRPSSANTQRADRQRRRAAERREAASATGASCVGSDPADEHRRGRQPARRGFDDGDVAEAREAR